MKENFDKAFKFVIGAEGKYSNDPDDPGGETKYGISKRAHPTLDIKSLTIDDAQTIYRSDYWDTCGCDDYAYPLDIIVFDTAVNMGVQKAKEIWSYNNMLSGDACGYLLIRAGAYAQLKNFNKYGRGWINRVFNLYKQFIEKGGE